MKTKTINLYSYSELSKEAQEKAHSKYIESNDYYFLSDCLNERLHELLQENNIKDLNDTSKPNTKPTQVQYSLSNCQGDGAMFAGIFEWKNNTITIEQSGRYYHSNSKTITYNDFVGEEKEHEEEKLAKEFEKIYQSICKELETFGYNFIDQENSLESFIELCEANDYTFLANGIMENE